MNKKFIKLISVFSFLLLWFILSKIQLLPLPGPIEVFSKFFELIFHEEPIMSRTLIDHSIASIYRVLVGSLIAFIIAIPFGIVLGLSEKVYIFFEPIIEFIRPIPPIAWIPISILLFGASGQIFIVFIGAIFPALLNTIHGVRGVEKKYIDVARSFNANNKQIITKVIIPASMHSILTGVRIGLGVAWMSIIAAEMISLSGSGLGYFILVMYEIGHEAAMIAGMVMIGIIGYLMNRILITLNRETQND